MAAKSNSKKKMSKEDSIYWDKLYQYVKKDIYKLDDDIPLPRSIILSLRGLKNGQVIANNKAKAYGDYPFKIVYLTFIYCKNKIDYALKTKNFKSYQQSFSYIRKIVEGNLINVYKKYKEKERQKNMMKENGNTVTVNDVINKEVRYKSQEKKINEELQKEFDSMW